MPVNPRERERAKSGIDREKHKLPERPMGSSQFSSSLEPRTEPGKCVGLHSDVELVRAIIEFPQVSIGSPNLIIVKGDAPMSGLHALDGKQIIVPVVLHEQGRRRSTCGKVRPVREPCQTRRKEHPSVALHLMIQQRRVSAHHPDDYGGTNFITCRLKQSSATSTTR
jgi:hypothetical protein